MKGIVKKVGYLLLVVVGVALDQLYPEAQGFGRMLICYFLIANEAISILENLGQIGIPYPKFLRRILEQLKNATDDGKIPTAGELNLPEKEVQKDEDEQLQLDLFKEHKFLLPVEEGWLSQGFTKSHPGIDIGWNNTAACKIYATEDGKVVQQENANTGGDRGEYIVIEHIVDDKKHWSAYLHLLKNSSMCKVGDKVVKGQLIGYRGSTGFSSGPHLHFYLSDGVSLDTKYSYATMKANCKTNPLEKLCRTHLNKDLDLVLSKLEYLPYSKLIEK